MNCVILCGGSGSRLWPLSREKMPKQFLPLVNENSMLQNTLLRLDKFSINNLLSSISIICNKEHALLVEKQICNLSLSIPHDKINIITEPEGRDTAPAVAIASLLHKEDEMTLMVPCDHVFDDNTFVNIVKQGLTYSENKAIVTLGIRPNTVSTGYGYIQINARTYETYKFIEKPNMDKAIQYVSMGNYYWNAGVFLFKNKDMIQCFEEHASDIIAQCRETLKYSEKNRNILNLSSEHFSKCKKISIDYAIMEKICSRPSSPTSPQSPSSVSSLKSSDDSIFVSKLITNNNISDKINGITIPYTSYWCDIGSFDALYEHLLQDKSNRGYPLPYNNITKGDVVINNTRNCYIQSDDGLVVGIGLDNLVIVKTNDVVLVCNKDNVQDIKKIVSEIPQNNK